MKTNPRENQSIDFNEEEFLKDAQKYAQLKHICHLACLKEKQALLGFYAEERIKIPEEYAPYKPENLPLWWEAAKLGIPDGYYLCGSSLINAGKAEVGKAILEKGIALNHVGCMRALGDSLMDEGNAEQKQTGFYLLKKAADELDAVACQQLGDRYEEGNGVSTDRKLYLEYMKTSAGLGSKVAEDTLKFEEIVHPGLVSRLFK